MFDHVQSELNKLLAIVQETAYIHAGLALDSTAKRSESTMQEFARKEVRKVDLMNKYNLTNNIVYEQRDAQSAA